MTKDKMVERHHGFNAHELEQAAGDGEQQGSLACCNPWGPKELDTTEQLTRSLSLFRCFMPTSIVVDQSLSRVRLFATTWTAGGQASLSFTISQNLLKLMSTETVMPSNHLILCRPLLLPPSVFSSIRFFSNESTLRIRQPKYWSFSFSITPSSEYSGLVSFRIDWFDLLAVQGILKSLLQHHSSKASILWHSAFFMV